MLSDFSTRPVTVTQGHLDYINSYRLMLESKMEISVDLEQQQTEIEFQKFRNIHEMSFDELFRFMKKAEALAAMCRLAIAKDPDKRRAELRAKDLEKIAEAREHRETQETQKIEKTAKKTPGVKDLLKLGLSPAEANRIVNREKAIAGLVSAGLTRELAEKSVDNTTKQ